MYRYFKNKRVKVVRNFILGGVSYTEIEKDGSSTIVNTKELKDNKDKSSVVQENDKLLSVVSDGEVKSSLEIDSEGIKLSAGEIKLEGNTEPKEDDNTSKPTHEEENDVEETEDIIVATNKKGKKSELGFRSELSDSKRVLQLKLDPEAIERCLDGKQKQHKGYTFELKG